MTAALAEAPAVAWFVPVTAPGRSPRRRAGDPAGRPAGRPRPPAGRPKRLSAGRRLALVGSSCPAAPVARAAVRTPPAPVAPRLRLTPRGAHVVALAALALTVLGGVGRLEAGPSVGAVSIARMAPGTPLASVAIRAAGVEGR